MNTTKISLFSTLMLLFVLFSSNANAEAPPRFQLVAGYIENVSYSNACQNCVTVSMKVEYTNNGQTFFQVSSSVVMNPNATQFFTVNIPKSATVVAKEFVFAMDNGTIMHDFAASNTGSYPSPGSNWCSCGVDPYEYLLLVDSTTGTNRFKLAPQGTVGSGS
ncbi:MAG: hypothetical protein P8P74_09450 [Crocinitomicaceae bacterium]|nr:hypothetical protein [Crocinitomicaceae bacterium]